MNSLTNLLLAAVSLSLAVSLRALFRRSGRNALRLWAFGFLGAATGAVLGALYHAPTPPVRTGVLWNALIFSAGLAAGFMVSAGYAARVNLREPRGLWMLSGAAVSAVGLTLQQSGLPVHSAFDHNDLYHGVQAVALYLVYRGARLC